MVPARRPVQNPAQLEPPHGIDETRAALGCPRDPVSCDCHSSAAPDRGTTNCSHSTGGSGVLSGQQAAPEPGTDTTWQQPEDSSLFALASGYSPASSICSHSKYLHSGDDSNNVSTEGAAVPWPRFPPRALHPARRRPPRPVHGRSPSKLRGVTILPRACAFPLLTCPRGPGSLCREVCPGVGFRASHPNGCSVLVFYLGPGA